MQAIVAMQHAELRNQSKELEAYRQQAKNVAANQRAYREKIVVDSATRIESILREQVGIFIVYTYLDSVLMASIFIICMCMNFQMTKLCGVLEQDISHLVDTNAGLQNRGAGLVHSTEELRAKINGCEADALRKVITLQQLVYNW